MSRKNRKKASPNSWLKDLSTGLAILICSLRKLTWTIVITIYLSDNDYQITTVIQLNASHHEASNLRLVVEHQSTRLQTANIWRLYVS